MALKWGVAGAGRISHDFVTSIQTLPNTQHRVVAVAAQNKERALKFAQEHNILKGYNEYEKLGEDGEIDIVYVGNLNTQHYEVCKMLMEFGKNILCEKPLVMNEKQAKSLVRIAKDNNVFLMEAVWSRCFPAYKKMKEIIDSGEIGDVMFCSINFGHALQHVDRLTSLQLGGGAILDLGIYILQFQQYVFRGLKPVDIAITGHLNSSGTDESAGAIITYPGGKMAVVTTSARVALPNEGVVVGTKGTLKLPLFWCPTELITPEKTYRWPLHESPVPYLHVNSAGLAYQAEEARVCIKNGLLENPSMTPEESIEIARLMDLMRKKLGVVFPEDSQEFE